MNEEGNDDDLEYIGMMIEYKCECECVSECECECEFGAAQGE